MTESIPSNSQPGPAPARPPRYLTIGIRGRAGSGKDTFTDYVCARLRAKGYTPRREAFANPLRECLQILTGIPVAESRAQACKVRELEDWGMTVGQMLQRLGTEAVRDNLHPDAWVMALMRRLGPDEIVVISDMRFPNEEAAVRARRGLVVEISRPLSAAAAKNALASRSATHVSEQPLESPPDVRIKNDGSLAELEKAAAALIHAHF